MNTARWNTAGHPHPLIIEYDAALFDELASLAMNGFRRSPAGGTEIGGLLLGRLDGDTVTILAHCSIAGEHAEGPAFRLSAADERALSQLLQDENSMQVVGWYHSEFWELALDKTSLDLHNRYFPERRQIAIVLKRARQQPVRFGLFLRHSDGSIKLTGEELAIDWNAPAPAAPQPVSLSAEKALLTLLERTGQRAGIMLVTAAPGVGKTTLLLRFGELLQSRAMLFALLLDPPLTPLQFYAMLGDDLEIHSPVRSKHHLKAAFQSFVQDRAGRIVILLDQAHRIPDNVLREILGIDALTDRQNKKLLQIILAGRSELNDRLASPDLTELLHAIAFRCTVLAGPEPCRDAAVREQLA
jgi:hypothetical protein